MSAAQNVATNASSVSAVGMEAPPWRFWTWTALARVAGAAKEIALAMVLGTSAWKDALVVTWTVPTLIASYCNETLPAILTPYWVRAGNGNDGLRRLRLLVFSSLALLSAAAAMFPGYLIHAIAPGLHGPGWSAAIWLERWLAVNVILLGGQAWLSARLNAARRFTWAPACVCLTAVASLLALVWTQGQPVLVRLQWFAAALTLGNALGLAAEAAIVHAARNTGSRAPARPPVTTAAPAQLWGSLASLLASAFVLNLIPLAERMAASRLPAGSLAAYDYGERLVQTVFSLTVAPLTAVSFTRLSELAPGHTAAFSRYLEQGLAGLLSFIAPVAVAFAVFAPLWTRCALGWGQFGARSLAMTSPVVAWKGGGLAVDAAFYFALFALYAGGRSTAKLPLALAVAACNIPLAFWWARRWGLAGLAAAHVAGYGAALAWMGARRRVYFPGLRLRPIGARLLGSLCLAGGAAGLTVAAIPTAARAGHLGAAVSWLWAAAVLSLVVGSSWIILRRHFFHRQRGWLPAALPVAMGASLPFAPTWPTATARPPRVEAL